MEKINSYEQLKSEVSTLFSKVYNYNYILLQKSEDENQHFKLDEVFDFYITSHAASFLKSFYIEYFESRGLLLNGRCIIEGLALRKMALSGKLDDVNLTLLKYQDALIEYRQYEDFFDLAPNIFFPSEMKRKYEDSINKYYELLKDRFDDKTIKRIIKSHNPFLCNPDINYHNIIKEYLGEDASLLYAMLSTLIHPNSNEAKNQGTIMGLLIDIVEIIRYEYNNLPSPINWDFRSYSNFVLSKPAEHYMNAIHRECKAFEELQKVFNDIYGNNYVSETLQEISMLIQEMTLDKIYGFSEQTKCKYKCMLELLASFFEVYVVPTKGADINNNYRLLQYHGDAMWHNDLGEAYDYNEAYSYYKNKYPNGVDIEKFSKVFSRTTGYTIDEVGHTKSLTDLIMNLYNSVISVFKTKEKILTIYDSAIIDYVESQMLSHANGYMWFANSGAWGDANNIFFEINAILSYIFNYLSIIFKDLYDDYKDKDSKKVSLAFDKAMKVINEVSKSIKRIQAIPQFHF